MAVLRGHDFPVLTVVFSPDATQLASGGIDKTIRLWCATTGAERAVLRGHSGPVLAAAFSQDGSLLASASDDNTVRVWDPDNGAELSVLAGHASGVHRVIFSQDGARLASVSKDATTRVWSTATGECLEVIRGVTDPSLLVDNNCVRSFLVIGGSSRSVVEDRDGRSLAVFPEPLRHIHAGSDGRTWSGAVDGVERQLSQKQIYMIRLEGQVHA
ncbi:MAG: hypothetical protein DWQ34_04180 [Planctomycetota bacterium]|nr:MAG: hypothetical protein DWQ34_04180 [Planctomycetota bacterium]